MDTNCRMQKSKIQTLYEACNLLFSQKMLPTSQQVQWLKNFLGMIYLVILFMLALMFILD